MRLPLLRGIQIMPEAVKWNLFSYIVVTLSIFPYASMTKAGCPSSSIIYYLGMCVSLSSHIGLLTYTYSISHHINRTRVEQNTLLFKMIVVMFIFFCIYFACYPNLITNHVYYIDSLIPVNYYWCHQLDVEEALLTIYCTITLLVMIYAAIKINHSKVIYKVFLPTMYYFYLLIHRCIDMMFYIVSFYIRTNTKREPSSIFSLFLFYVLVTTTISLFFFIPVRIIDFFRFFFPSLFYLQIIASCPDLT